MTDVPGPPSLTSVAVAAGLVTALLLARALWLSGRSDSTTDVDLPDPFVLPMDGPVRVTLDR